MKRLLHHFLSWALALALIPSSWAVTDTIGQWNFDRGNLDAVVGQPLEYLGGTNGPTAAGTSFGTTTSFGIPDINGVPTPVMHVPGDNSSSIGYVMRHGFAANGGGTRVNQFTLIFDIFWEPFSSGQASFANFDPNNAGDADVFFRRSDGGFGQGGGDGFSGNTVMMTGRWHRVVFAYDMAAIPPVLTKYLDGVKHADQLSGNGLDNTRRSMPVGGIVLVGDGDADEQGACYLSCVQVRAGKMSDAEMAALGGPSAGKIPLPPPPTRLFLNEWLVDAVTDCCDPIDGQHDDWFEIYNPTTNAVDLRGLYLTDWSSNDFKFLIPSGYRVSAGGFLRVWADNQPQQNSTNSPDLHVNFTLPNGGGNIGLYAPDGTALDAITFGAQTPDVSEGRFPDGGSNRYFMTQTTPGAANVLAFMLACPDNLTLHTCSNALPVHYQASLTGGCPPVNVTYNPPSGSSFTTGTTTPVTVSAVDSCGRSNSCVFTVTILPAGNFWQSFPAGVRDCYALPDEPASRGPCLNSAYPGALWKNFDDPTVDRFFGHTWNLPNAIYQDGWLVTRMKDYNCQGGSPNDIFSLGLQNCSPLSWFWSRSLGPNGGSPGLQSSNWCNLVGCGHLFNLHLSALPLATGGTTTVLPAINATFPRRLDMLVQDDTRLDFAWLRMRRCPPQHILGGLAVDLTNAHVVHGPGSVTLTREAGATNFSATFDLGSASGVRFNFQDFTLPPVTNGAPAGAEKALNLRVAGLEGGSDWEFRLSRCCPWDSNETVHVQLVRPVSGATHVDVRTFSNGVAVASHTLPATAGMELASFPASLPITRVDIGTNDAFFVGVGDVTNGKNGYAIRMTGNTTVIWPLATVALAIEGFDQITLGQPEIGVNRIDPMDDYHWDEYASVSGDAIARAENGQITLSALDAMRPGSMSLGLRPCPCCRCTTNVRDGTNEFRATIQTSFGQFSAVPSNASLNLVCIIDPTDGQYDDEYRVNFLENAKGWGISATHSNAPLPLRNLAYWTSNEYRTVSMSGPVSISVSEPPHVYWPSTTWFVEADICHRFLWNCPVTVWIDDTAYETTELRFLTDGPGGAQPFKGLRVETTGAEALVLSSLETGPVRYKLDPPVRDGDDIIIRGNPLGGDVQSISNLGTTNAWKFEPFTDGEMRTKITNAPRMFYRIKGR